jgi:hypothetical protein
MKDDNVEAQITNDNDNQNVSRSEIMFKGGRDTKLMKKSNLSGCIIDTRFRPDDHFETDPHSSPGEFKEAEYGPALTSKSDKDIGIDFEEAASQIIDKKDTDSNLPLINYYVPLLVSPNSLIDIFMLVWNHQKFQIIEKEEAYATAVLKQTFSFKKLLFNWLPVFGGEDSEDGSISAVRILISVNEAKSCRKITLRGLYGNYNGIKSFFKLFNRKIQNKLNKGIPKLERQRRKASSKLSFDNNYNEISLITEEENKHNMSNGEANMAKDINQKFTYYYYHKILSSDQYSLGKMVSEFIENYNTEYQTPDSLHNPSKAMNEALSAINGIVKNLYSTYNISGNNKNLMQFWRTSVEKFIFGKIYHRIFALYKLKYKEIDDRFMERTKLTKATDPISMLKHLGVNKKYIIWDAFKFSNSESEKYEFSNNTNTNTLTNETVHLILDTKSKEGGNSYPHFDRIPSHVTIPKQINLHDVATPIDSSNVSGSEDDYSTPSTRDKELNDELLPYNESIKAMERIKSFTWPREKLDWVIDFFSNMKSSIVDHWKGKVELQTMDDILPLCIYWVWYWNTANFASEINFLKDFINAVGDDNTDSIERTLVNIEMGIQYVNTTDEFPFNVDL